MDFIKEEIVNIWNIVHTSLTIVQLSSLKLVAYDAEHAELYGRLSLTSGIPGQRIEFTLVKADDAVLLHATPPPESSAEPPVEMAGDKDGKGKGKGHEKVNAPPEEGLEDVVAPPEPSLYLVRKNLTGVACASAQVGLNYS